MLSPSSAAHASSIQVTFPWESRTAIPPRCKSTVDRTKCSPPTLRVCAPLQVEVADRLKPFNCRRQPEGCALGSVRADWGSDRTNDRTGQRRPQEKRARLVAAARRVFGE